MLAGNFTRWRPFTTLNSLTAVVPILEWVKLREALDAESRNLARNSSGTRRCGAYVPAPKLGRAAALFDELLTGGAARAVAVTQDARKASDAVHSVALELQCMPPPFFLKSILFFQSLTTE